MAGIHMTEDGHPGRREAKTMCTYELSNASHNSFYVVFNQ